MKKSSTEFRQMQRDRIFQVKPWEKSTGAKTAEGKARSKMNALKISPELHSLIRDYKQLVRQQKEICSIVNYAK